jgi:hypothetical protein
MSRKITFVAVFAVALTFTADSQAFAKGSKGGNKGGSRGGRQTAHHNHGGQRGGRFEHGHRGGWGYDYASYPVVVAEAPLVEASVVDDDSVVEATPVIEATPVVATYDSYYFGGYRGHDFRHNQGRTGGHHSQGGHTGHGKK